MSADFLACRRSVEAADPDRALSLSFAPVEKQQDLAALYAFDIETQRIRSVVREPLPGEIRIQWWRDTLSAEGEGGGGHPIAAAVDEVIRRNNLPRSAFDRLLEGRIADLYDDPMPSTEDFEAYAGETASTVIMLASMIMSRSAAETAADAAGHAGVAQAAVGALRHLPLHRSRRQLYIPQDILSSVGCSADELLAGDEAAAGRAISAMVAFARQHARTARTLYAGIPKELRPAYLPALLSETYLNRIEKAGLSVLDRTVDLSPLRKSFIYWQLSRI